MSLDYTKLAKAPRLLMEAELEPLQGKRFQPTGFADLGPARYTLADGTEMLLVESAQSVANHLEKTVIDESTGDLLSQLKGLPYVTVDCGRLGTTTSLKEFHRLNSPYIWSGEATDKTAKFRADFCRAIGVAVPKKKKKKDGDDDSSDADAVGVLDFHRFYEAVFKWDPNSVIHGLFLEKVAGRLRMTRVLSGFIEASEIKPAENGGTKVDHVLPSPKLVGLNAKDGYGNVPFHRTDFVAKKIVAYFNLDLALIRGYRLNEVTANKATGNAEPIDANAAIQEKEDVATHLLIALSLLKIRRFLSGGLRLRANCDLQLVGKDVVATRPTEFPIPSEGDLLTECERLIEECRKRSLFADPAVTPIEWISPTQKATKISLPVGTAEPRIPKDAEELVKWKAGTTKKGPTLEFPKGLDSVIVEQAKTLFPDNDPIHEMLDKALEALTVSAEKADEAASDGTEGDQ